jgi:hypothetical protein
MSTTKRPIKPGDFTVFQIAMLSLSFTHRRTSMLTTIMLVALGAALASVLPTGVEPGTKYEPLTEADFHKMLGKVVVRSE